MAVTHAMGHWLADEHSAGFAPAFALWVIVRIRIHRIKRMHRIRVGMDIIAISSF